MGISSAIIESTLAGALNLVDELFTTEEERASAKLKLVELEHQGKLAQLAVNAEEAKSTNLFVSGWRPSIGWICALSFAITFVLMPIIQSIAVYYTAFSGEYIDLSGLPVLDMSTIMPVLLGMLGLGGLRSYEKTKGVTR